MRGSPVIRCILLTVGLLMSALGLQRVTSNKTAPGPVITQPIKVEKSAMLETRYHLLPSAEPVEISLNSQLIDRIGSLSGLLAINPANPQVALQVRWKNKLNPGEHRFAKLTLEAPGHDTFTHVFDAQGDIDDIIELPFPAEK